MAMPLRRGRLLTMQELLESQRETAASRCKHCGRDGTDRDHELVETALRARIRILEAQLGEVGLNPGGQA